MDFCGLLRMFENVFAGSPWDEGGLFFKPLIMRESGKVKGENGKRKGEMNPSVATRQLPYKQGSKKVHSPLKKV